MHYRKPSLAALVLVIGCTVAWLITVDKRVAFADVVQQIRESQTISFRITSKAKGFPTMVARQTMAAPRYIRISMRMGDKGSAISIFDHEKSAGITLMTGTKQAIKMTSSDDLSKQSASSSEFIEWLKTSPDHAEEDLGPRTIDGKATFGFRVSKDGEKWDIWIDQESRLPVRMETKMEFLGKTAAVVMDKFAFDHKLNLSLFSLTPPPGYTVIDELEVREPSEQDVVDLLRHLAESNDGEFTPDLNLATLMKLGKNEPKEPMKTGLKKTLTITRGFMFLKMKEAKYTGRGVKLGDAERVVCWWTPEGKDMFRAVYGDLTVRDGDGQQPP